jgi:peptidoglycan-associated lipoprotein
MNRACLVVALTTVLSACSTLFPQRACEPAAPVAPVATANTSAAETDTQRQERLMWELSTKSIYFEPNGYSVKPEYQDFLKQIYKFLQTAPEYSIGLIGNADERGHGQSVVGQRRADAVKQVFKSLGLSEDRIQAISLGDKNPRATCHAETCWSQNRRVDIVFLGATTPNIATAPPARSQ